MLSTKKLSASLLCFVMLAAAVSALIPLTSPALYWTPLPPYNVLWPLWSPALSPLDPVTGIPTPLITSLTRNTILPVQPGLAWDPCQPNVEAFPWLLYNAPAAFGGGLVYYDVYYGINPWPPSYMLDPISGAPAPIALPATWTLLGPTSLSHFDWFVPLANALFNLQYGVPISSLLTTADIWGLTPLAALTSPII
ncbi:MAG: hypothetical protein ACMUIL_14020 [bacterium]